MPNSQLALPPLGGPEWMPVSTDHWEYGSVLESVASQAGGIITAYDVLPFPQDCYDFMMSQFQRFQLPWAPMEMLRVFWNEAIFFLDVFSPDAFFGGLTDVISTEDRYYFTFEIQSEDGRLIHMPPEDIQTFKLWPPGNGNYEYMMRHPGLKGDDTAWELKSLMEEFEEKVDWGENDDINEAKTFFGSHFKNVSHLALWAGSVWLLSPLPAARKWREDTHLIFNAVYKYGECLVDFGNLYLPMQYKKLEVPVQTCVVCNTRLPCANPVKFSSGNWFFCCDACYTRTQQVENNPYHDRWQRSSCDHCALSSCPHQQNKVAIPRGMILRSIMARNAPRYDGPPLLTGT